VRAPKPLQGEIAMQIVGLFLCVLGVLGCKTLSPNKVASVQDPSAYTPGDVQAFQANLDHAKVSLFKFENTDLLVEVPFPGSTRDTYLDRLFWYDAAQNQFVELAVMGVAHSKVAEHYNARTFWIQISETRLGKDGFFQRGKIDLKDFKDEPVGGLIRGQFSFAVEDTELLSQGVVQVLGEAAKSELDAVLNKSPGLKMLDETRMWTYEPLRIEQGKAKAVLAVSRHRRVGSEDQMMHLFVLENDKVEEYPVTLSEASSERGQTDMVYKSQRGILVVSTHDSKAAENLEAYWISSDPSQSKKEKLESNGLRLQDEWIFLEEFRPENPDRFRTMSLEYPFKARIEKSLGQ
jgi:hypothetical protein